MMVFLGFDLIYMPHINEHVTSRLMMMMID